MTLSHAHDHGYVPGSCEWPVAFADVPVRHACADGNDPSEYGCGGPDFYGLTVYSEVKPMPPPVSASLTRPDTPQVQANRLPFGGLKRNDACLRPWAAPPLTRPNLAVRSSRLSEGPARPRTQDVYQFPTTLAIAALRTRASPPLALQRAMDPTARTRTAMPDREAFGSFCGPAVVIRTKTETSSNIPRLNSATVRRS